ncbi:unnamed protein product [Cylicocyclus nassatus]|uniref:Uncharacterized protein n=1 Tax=Cylicocyclus nassatus TaxID=53992 RepID=A0AA36DNN8_CYLNA|nr:unnamed protein product [Cylicocyclus nassatus]
MVFVTSIVCLIDLFCFTVTIIKWRILTKKNKLQSKTEKSLLFLACSICISHSANCTVQVFFYYSVHFVLSFLVRDFVYDVLTFVPTWVLYMTHPAFGKAAYKVNASILIMNSVKS